MAVEIEVTNEPVAVTAQEMQVNVNVEGGAVVVKREGGLVDSVNGKTGDVELNYEDVGAMPNTFKESDPTVPAWAKQSTKPTYTASEVGADSSGTAGILVGNHNTNTSDRKSVV